MNNNYVRILSSEDIIESQEHEVQEVQVVQKLQENKPKKKRAASKRVPAVFVAKNNSLIQSIGKTTLLSNKVFLTSLMKIADRDASGVMPSEKPYYKNLAEITGTDYSKGLVAEFSTTELRSIMNTSSGSFYQAITDLLSPTSINNLRDQWTIYIKDPKSGSFGFTNMIMATFYDNKSGRMFIKFSQEKKVREMLIDYKNNFTKLNYALMMRFKSVYTYRLYEILMSRIGWEDGVSKKKKNDYCFRYEFAELKFLLGIIDPKTNKDIGAALQSLKPDYEKIEAASGGKQIMRYIEFRRNVLEKVKQEIDSANGSEFYFNYEPVRSGRGGKVVAIDLLMERKDQIKEAGSIVEVEDNKEAKKEDIDAIHKLICTTLKKWIDRDDCEAVARAAGYNYWKVRKALEFMSTSGSKIENVVGFLISSIKDDYSEPESWDPDTEEMNFVDRVHFVVEES